MILFEIRPRPTNDGVNLTGPLGGCVNSHWFSKVSEAANYAKLRAEQMGGGLLRVFRADGSLRGERLIEEGTSCLGPIPHQP
jgi:hypothetical protein